jgi:hypothetical protein
LVVKKKIKLLIVLLLLISIQFFTFNVNSKTKHYGEVLDTNNVGAPNYMYNDIIKNGSYVYCLRLSSIDIFNIENFDKIILTNRIYDSNLWFTNHYYGYNEYNIEKREISKYFMYETVKNNITGEFNLTICVKTYQINETHFTNFDTYIYNTSIRGNFESYYIYKINNTLCIFIENYYANQTSQSSYYKLHYLLVDVTNKSSPVISDPVILHQEIDYVNWNGSSKLTKDDCLYSMQNNQFCIARIIREKENTSSNYMLSNSSLKLWDMSNLSKPILTDSFKIENWTSYTTISIQDNYIYYTLSKESIIVYEIANQNKIQKKVEYFGDEFIRNAVVNENILYLINLYKIEILDISNPTDIKPIKTYKIRFQGNGDFRKGIIEDDVLYVIRSSEFDKRSLFIFDCSNPDKIKRVYPLGLKLSQEVIENLLIYSSTIGFFVGVILVIVVIILVVRRFIKVRKRKKEKKSQVTI